MEKAPMMCTVPIGHPSWSMLEARHLAEKAQQAGVPHLHQRIQGLLQACVIRGATMHKLQALHAQERHPQRESLLQLFRELVVLAGACSGSRKVLSPCASLQPPPKLCHCRPQAMGSSSSRKV